MAPVRLQLGSGPPVMFPARVSIDYVRGNDLGADFVGTARGYYLPTWIVALLGEDFFFTPRRALLQSIDLSSNALASVRLECFPRLDLTGCRLDKASIRQLAKLEGLRELTLVCCELQGTDLASLAKLPRLESLTLCQMAVGGEDVAQLTPLDTLEHLSLQENGLSPGDLSALRALPGLRSLNLAGNQRLLAADLELVRELPELQGINLTQTGVDEKILPLLRQLPRLKWVSITASTPEVAERIRRQEAQRDGRLTIYVE